MDRVTIGAVAERAGVSIATVSRVVNQRYGVAPETLKRVSEVIAQMGYESSLVARSLRSQRTNIIGILVADFEPFSAELLKGVAAALRNSPYELIVYSGGGHRDDEGGWERRYLSRIAGTLTDGTILVTPTVVDVPHTFPVVAVDPHAGESSLPTVAAQNFEGAVAATEYLIELGHTRIGFLGGRPDLESARQREAGFRHALQQAGIAFDPHLVQVGGFTQETADAPARALLNLTDRPTAIFAANDQSAIQTMRAAELMGINVPDELSVIGFDNVPESALTTPPLTTVDQSIQRLGFEAVRILLGLIDRFDATTSTVGEPAHITLPTELVIRSSCHKREG